MAVLNNSRGDDTEAPLVVAVDNMHPPQRKKPPPAPRSKSRDAALILLGFMIALVLVFINQEYGTVVLSTSAATATTDMPRNVSSIYNTSTSVFWSTTASLRNASSAAWQSSTESLRNASSTAWQSIQKQQQKVLQTINNLQQSTTEGTPASSVPSPIDKFPIGYLQVPQAQFIPLLPPFRPPLRPLNGDKSQLLQRIKEARDVLFAKLQADYGKAYFERIFLAGGVDNVTQWPVTRGRRAFVPPNPGQYDTSAAWKRMTRKFKIKLLQALTTRQFDLEQHPTSFVWATGGHSASASHGNLFNQSYTIYLHEAMQPVFANLGMHFEGRNYAVGASQSAPEPALCAEAIFGLDVDVLSWDYGMTDGRGTLTLNMYAYHAGIMKTRPAVVVFPHNWPYGKDVELAALERIGLIAFLLHHLEMSQGCFAGVPESTGLTEEQLNALPPYVQRFKCNGRLEDGDDLCKTLKFDQTLCPARRFKTSWHPGWRWHALHGNIMAMFLLEHLQDAAKEIVAAPSETDLGEWLETLEQEEEAEYARFRTSNLPAKLYEALKPVQGAINQSHFTEIIFNNPLICNTAWLPNEARYRGVMTGTPISPWQLEQQLQDVNVTADQLYASRLTPERTFRWLIKNQTDGRAAPERPPSSLQAPLLVAELSERQICPVMLNIDHRDSYYLHQKDGLKTFIIPNAREQAYFKHQGKPWGILLYCTVQMSDHKVKGGNVITEGRLSINVNGIPVSGLSPMYFADRNDAYCFFLRHDLNLDESLPHPALQFPANDEGRFVIGIQVKRPGEFIKISSIMTWYMP